MVDSTEAARGIDPDNDAWQIAAWIGVLLLAVAGVYLAFVGRWTGVGTVAVFAIASAVLIVAARDTLPEMFSFLFVAAAGLNAAGWVWNLFKDRQVVWYDEFVHFFTPGVIGLVIIFWFHFKLHREGRPPLRAVWYTAGLALLLAGLWEVVEWIAGIIGQAGDTITDLLMGFLGGVVAGFVGRWLIAENPEHEVTGDEVTAGA